VSDLEAVRNGSRVESLGHEIGGGLKQSTGHDDNGCGTITSLNILSLGDFDKHSSGGVDDLHLFEDSGTIIGDQNFTLGCLDHFIHASWSEGSSHDISDGLGGDDVGGSDVSRLLRFDVCGLIL